MQDKSTMITITAELVDKKGLKVNFIFVGFYPRIKGINNTLVKGIPIEMLDSNRKDVLSLLR